MNETLQGWLNLLRSCNPDAIGVQFGMFVEIGQALQLDGATQAEWEEWRQTCANTNTVHGYVARTLYRSSGGVR